MKQLELSKTFTLMESGPVVIVTTHDGKKNNIMTISWTMVMDFTPFCSHHGCMESLLRCVAKESGVRHCDSHRRSIG